MAFIERDPRTGQMVIITPFTQKIIPPASTTSPETTPSASIGSSEIKATATPTISTLFYNPLEQLIAKTNPDMAKKMYESRIGGTPTTPPIISTKPVAPLILYTPFEQSMMKINPELAKTLYEKRTGTTIPSPGGMDIKAMLAQGPLPEGAYQKEPGGPVYIMSDEENALLNAQRIRPSIAIQHGVTITDQDYGSEISRLSADITSGQGSVQSERQWLQDYKTYEQNINQNIATIRTGPSDARWEIDINQDKKIDSNEVFTSQQAIDYFQGELTNATETKQKVEENIPLMESDIRSMKESKIYLEEYQRKGYYFDVKNGEYIFTEPKASDVVEKLYGNRPDLYIASELRTLGFGVLFAGGQQLITGAPSLEALKEATAESILGATRLPGESVETHAVRFWTSPEAIADVWVPVATLGLSKGATLLGRVVGPSLISAGSKLAGEVGPTGARIISGAKTIAVGAGKVLSQPVVRYGTKYGMYGALEAPTLIDIAQNRPSEFGAALGKSLFRWEVAWGAMDIGFSSKHQIISKTPVDEELFVGTPVTEDVFMRDIQKKIQTSGPKVFIGEEQKLAEFGIKPKYTIIEQGKGPGFAEVKIREFKGYTPDIIGEPRTSFTGYIVTSDKPVVLQTGERAQRWWGEASTELHPSLTPGEEIFVSKERSLVFGTTATRIETKASLFTKQERTIFSEFKGISEEPMETAYHYRTPRLEEPGITTKSYISKLTIKPRSGEALTVTGLGESRQGYPALFSEMNKNKLIITEGTRAKTEFVGEISPRIGPQYEKQFVKEYGDVFSKTKAGAGVETGISGGEISVIKPTQASLLKQIEGIEIKVSKGLSGGTGVLKLLAEKETTKVIEKIGAPKGATAGGMLLSQTAEEETITYVKSPYARTQGLTQETEYISQQWNETRPRQGTRTLTLTGMTLENLVGTGELNINERDQFTREISGLGLKSDVGFEELTKPDFGMRTLQDTRTDLMQSSRQEQQSLSRMDQATDLISISPVEPTPTYTPGGIRIRPPRLFRRKKDEDEEKKYYKPVKRQRDLLKKSHKTRTKGLTADILSVTQSQARYGKATQPRLTKQLWEESEKTLFKRVPTEELLKGGRTKADNLLGNKNKGGKKNVYY